MDEYRLGPVPQHLQKEYKIGEFIEVDVAVSDGNCMIGFMNQDGRITSVHAEVFSGIAITEKPNK